MKKAQKIPLYVRGLHHKNDQNEKQVEIPAPYIKEPSEKKYTLVLDLDETLIHFKVVRKIVENRTKETKVKESLGYVQVSSSFLT